MKIQCGDNIVGELRLLDPRNDREPDNFNMLPFSEDAELLHDDPNWALVIQQIHHSVSNNPLDFWAALDTIFMMAMQGFKVRAWGYNDKYVFVNGECLPDSTDQYGRFMFYMDVTTRRHWTPHGKDAPALIRPAFDLSGIDLTQATEQIDYRDAAGNPIALAPDEELFHGTVIKKECESLPPITIPTAEDIERFQANLPHRDKWSDIKVDLPTADQLTDALMNPTGYLILMDEDGNPISPDKNDYYRKAVGKHGMPGGQFTYSKESLANLDIGKLDSEIRALQAKYLGLPPELVSGGLPSFSIRAVTGLGGAHSKPFLADSYTMPAHLAGKMPGVVGPLANKPAQPIMSVSELMAAAEHALSVGVVTDLPMPQGKLTIHRDKHRPAPQPGDEIHYEIDWSVLTDPTRFVEQPKTWKGACEETALPNVSVMDGSTLVVHAGGVDIEDVLTFGTVPHEPDDSHDIPTTDLDLEADPSNWDGFLDGDSAAGRHEDGDTSK